MKDSIKVKGANHVVALPKDGLRELALFAGAGGGILGGLLHGWRTVAAVEIEDYPRRVLLQRQADGVLPRFPVWDDVCTFDGKPWRGLVDVISGGFPCTNLSTAAASNGNMSGLEGESSGLWSEFQRIICEVRPRYVFVENSPMLTLGGLGVVLSDLAKVGYNARWCVLGADTVGLDHKRNRIWIKATKQNKYIKKTSPNTNCNGLEGRNYCNEKRQRHSAIGSMERLRQNQIWHDLPPPDSFGTANGLDHRMDRLKAIGNGQVPQVAALAWQILTEENTIYEY